MALLSVLETKLNAITQLSLPLSNDPKIVSIFQRVNGEMAFANFVIQKRDGQTKQKQTNKQKHRTFSPPPGGARSPTSSKLGMMIDLIRTMLAFSKHICI